MTEVTVAATVVGSQGLSVTPGVARGYHLSPLQGFYSLRLDDLLLSEWRKRRERVAGNAWSIYRKNAFALVALRRSYLPTEFGRPTPSFSN